MGTLANSNKILFIFFFTLPLFAQAQEIILMKYSCSELKTQQKTMEEITQLDQLLSGNKEENINLDLLTKSCVSNQAKITITSWIIREKDTHNFVGIIFINQKTMNNKTSENFDINLFIRPEFRKKGIAKKALLEVMHDVKNSENAKTTKERYFMLMFGSHNKSKPALERLASTMGFEYRTSVEHDKKVYLIHYHDF